jgi:hypothetical protein
MPTPTWNGIQTSSVYNFVNRQISSFMLFNWAESTTSSPDTKDFNSLLNYLKLLLKSVKQWSYPSEQAPIIDLVTKKITWARVLSPFFALYLFTTFANY